MEPTTAAVPPTERARAWLEKHRRGALVGLVAAAALLRLAYFLELNDGALLSLHKSRDHDMAFFDEWARAIAEGDWLSNGDRHPFHEWHAEIARRSAAGKDARELWNRWYGGRTFHQEPLYVYVIAVTYRLFGPDPRWVFLWQMLAGILTIALAHDLARRWFDDLVAFAAGSFVTLCGPLLMFDLVLLRTSFIAAAGVAIVWLAERALERGGWRRWLAAGAAAGLGVLLQATLVLVAIGVMAVLAWRTRRRATAGFREAALFAGGFAAALVPLVARNVTVGAPPLALASVGPITFLCANTEDYDPDRAFVPSFKHAPRIMSETDGRMAGVVRASLATHPSAWSYVKLVAGKVAASWQWVERPNNANFYHYRLYSRTLRACAVTFAILAPLGLLGLGLAVRRFERTALAYGLIAAVLVPMLVFYVLGRFRAPMTPALAAFAAFAAVEMVRWAWERRARAVAAGAVALAALGAWTWRPVDGMLVGPRDHGAAFDAYYFPRATEALERQRWDRSATLMEDLLAREPEFMKRVGRGHPPAGSEENMTAFLFGNARHLYATSLERLGRREDAAREMKRAVEILEVSERPE